MNNSAKNQLDFPQRMLALGEDSTAKLGDIWSMVRPELGSTNVTLDASTQEPDNDFLVDSPYKQGAWRSYVPVLGEILWEVPKETVAKVPPYYAYTCKLNDGKQVGYVRIPHYTYNKRAVASFEELITRFESTTDIMVIDQINNDGGSMFQMYALLSTLTDRPLSLPQHQITIFDDLSAICRRNGGTCKSWQY